MVNIRPVVRIKDAPTATGLTRTAWFGAVKAGLMPPGFLIDKRSRAVFVDEVASVMSARAAGQTEDEIRALVSRLVKQRQEQAPGVTA